MGTVKIIKNRVKNIHTSKNMKILFNRLKYLKYVLITPAFIFIMSVLFYFYQISTPVSKDKTMISLEISSGESTKQIATELKSLGVIRNVLWMRVYFKLNNLSSKLIADTFSLSPSMSIKQIASIITSTNREERRITVIEGWNANQIGAYLEKQSICSSSKWASLIEDYKEDYLFLENKPSNMSLEGYLFPDTYTIYKNASCEIVLKKMLDNFENRVNEEMMGDIKSQNKSLFEILTMASIIEKEVNNVEDMKIVSGIFWNRIKNNQALQSCATLAYILGENKEQYSYEDTQINSYYNTYKNKGLTPGPITNPGLNAIKASIYPQYTDYNYFLTDLDTGKTIFSKTYDEHLKNKAKYLD